mgnify:CR=1 FL=1
MGHACYEQAIEGAYGLTPVGQGVSMGVHESQSRIYENQLGRSRAFTGWLYSRMTETFGDLGLDGPDAFYAAVNRVTPGFSPASPSIAGCAGGSSGERGIIGASSSASDSSISLARPKASMVELVNRIGASG